MRNIWRLITNWCDSYAPLTAMTIRGPCDEATLLKAQDATGLAWPHDLVASLRLHDGTSQPAVGDRRGPHGILFNYHPLSCTQIAETYDHLLRTARAQPPDTCAGAEELRPAGTPARGFHAYFLPVATGGPGTLMIDLRPGEWQGCLVAWPRGQAQTTPPLASGLAALLTYAARRFAGSDDIQSNQHPNPVADGGVCRWVGSRL